MADFRDNADHESIKSIDFLGMSFQQLDLNEVIDLLTRTYGRFRFVATPNVQHLVNYLDEPDRYEPIYRAAWLSLCDGRFLPLIARLNGVSLKPASGSDLTERLMPIIAENNWPITVIGPRPEDVAALQERFPGLDVKGYCPPFGFLESEEQIKACVDFVVENPARFVFIALGTPRQEIIAKHILEDGRAQGVGLCVGASIDFLVGRQVRAPRWMQKFYLEWFHRMMQDPRRLAHRYLIHNPKIFLHVVRHARAKSNRGLTAPKS